MLECLALGTHDSEQSRVMTGVRYGEGAGSEQHKVCQTSAVAAERLRAYTSEKVAVVIRMSVDSDMFWCLREICSMRTFWVFSVAGFSSRTGTARNVWSIWSRRCPQQRWFAQRGRSKALSTNLNAKHGDLHQFQRQALAVSAEG